MPEPCRMTVRLRPGPLWKIPLSAAAIATRMPTRASPREGVRARSPSQSARFGLREGFTTAVPLVLVGASDLMRSPAPLLGKERPGCSERGLFVYTPGEELAVRVVLVTGAPCSGKTTYVTQHKGPEDVVVDYDALCVALGSGDSHDHPRAVRRLATVARDAVLRRIGSGRGLRGTAWVIATDPDEGLRGLAHEEVELQTPMEECIRRARAAGRPGEWVQYIEDHFSRKGAW